MPRLTARACVRGLLSALSALIVLTACSAGSDGALGGKGGSHSGSAGSGSTTVLDNQGGGGAATSLLGSGGSGPQTPTGQPSPDGTEICNGIDDDHNGIIDDVDVNKDGICDCLRIATVGVEPMHQTGTIFSGWLQARSSSTIVKFRNANWGQNDPITPELLAGIQVLVGLNFETVFLTPEEIATVTAWVKGGGGLMTTAGYSPDGTQEIPNVNKLLNFTGMQYAPGLILPAPNRPTVIVDITDFTQHDVTDQVKAVGWDWGEAVNGGTTLARNSGHPLLGVNQVGEGHVLVWGDEWIMYDVVWQNNAKYTMARFWANVMKWLSPPRQCKVEIPPLLH